MFPANTQRGPEETSEESYNDESIVDEPATVEDEPPASPASTNSTMASITATAASTSTTAASTSNMSQAKKRKRRNDADNAQNKMLLHAYSILKKTSETSTDHYETFGMHVTSELRKYDCNTLPHVKRAILDMLFRADIGEFNPTHNVRNTADYYSSNYSTPTPTLSGGSYPPTPTPPPSDALLIQSEIDPRSPLQEGTSLLHYLTNITPEQIE
ncbi:hypothetical protein J6590_088158 [Homalodisca vitripennis]|nr:hypothetical protein J6590_088158 [Homalodisca vitripennis]